MSKHNVGITVTKDEDVSEWYNQLMIKADLIDFSNVSGCYILKPWSFAIWEEIVKFADSEFKKDGVQNVYFPLFIPKSLLTKEQEHVEGFTPEVAWVTQTGDSELSEPLAVRPTSETIMYASYSKWIRSFRDLPLRYNQWANVVRWEFKHATPFLRSREFLWQEGHSAFATKQEAVTEVEWALEVYRKIAEELLAVPVIKGEKSKGETFAGAEFSLSIETFLPGAKALQMATSHHLGQIFSKAFDITFTNADQKEEHVFQNSWGISTRLLGSVVLMHGDDKGLVLPVTVAPIQVVIIPLLFKGKEEIVHKKVEEITEQLKQHNVRVHCDNRDFKPGFKFNEWEMRGVPLRVEIGPRDVEQGVMTVACRHTGEKKVMKSVDEIVAVLKTQSRELLEKAREKLKEKICKVTSLEAFEQCLENKQWCYMPWCCLEECEEHMKNKYKVRSNCIPLEQEELPEGQVCPMCSKKAKKWAYIAKVY